MAEKSIFASILIIFRASIKRNRKTLKKKAISVTIIKIINLWKRNTLCLCNRINKQPSVEHIFLFVIGCLQFYSSYHVKPNIIHLLYFLLSPKIASQVNCLTKREVCGDGSARFVFAVILQITEVTLATKQRTLRLLVDGAIVLRAKRIPA